MGTFQEAGYACRLPDHCVVDVRLRGTPQLFKLVKQTHGVVSSKSGSFKLNKRRVMQLRKQLAKEFNDETGLSPDHRNEWEQWLKQNGHWPVIPNKKRTTAQPFCVQVEDKIAKA